MHLPILDNLRKPVSALVGLGVSVLLFDAYYYMMVTFPGTIDRMCVIGANFNPTNVAFSIVLALMTGIMVSAIVELARRRRAQVLGSSASGVGFVVGTFTVFCTFCTIPVISLFGLSVSLSFFTTYEIWFKGASLILMIAGLYLLNKQLDGECEICKI